MDCSNSEVGGVGRLSIELKLIEVNVKGVDTATPWIRYILSLPRLKGFLKRLMLSL
jgi:hypothetical protein